VYRKAVGEGIDKRLYSLTGMKGIKRIGLKGEALSIIAWFDLRASGFIA
jgi:hypothetical protein